MHENISAASCECTGPDDLRTGIFLYKNGDGGCKPGYGKIPLVPVHAGLSCHDSGALTWNPEGGLQKGIRGSDHPVRSV